MSKKNLDKLFQEKFSNYSDVPTEKVWKSIEASLNTKKKNRRVIPFWWKLGGIAAALAIGIFLMTPFSDTSSDSDTIITDVENVKEKNPKEIKDNDQAPISNSQKVVEQTQLADVENGGNKEGDTHTSRLNTSNTLSTPSKNEGEVAIGQSQGSVKNQHPEITQMATNDTDKAGKNILDNETAVAIGEKIAENENGFDYDADKSKNNENNLDGNSLKDKKEEIAAIEVLDSKAKSEDGKKSIFDVLETQEEEITEAKESKWAAGPRIAPVYFNAMGNGSPVHSIFISNSKSGDVNLSYGLGVSYEISKKLSIKTGIHKVDYAYNTNDVEFSPILEGLGNGQIENINYSRESRNIVVESKTNNINSLTERTAVDVAAQDPSLSGIMAQQFGYLEIPLELNYALIDNKFGVDLIGGFSSLFLVDNAVSLSSGELTTEMGEANNLNTMNFSTNIGFGVNYRFTSRLQLNIEPIFKYQLNTFSNTAGDFRPFTIGVYSGLNFRF